MPVISFSEALSGTAALAGKETVKARKSREEMTGIKALLN